jgi:lipid-A-disaccharide synthase
MEITTLAADERTKEVLRSMPVLSFQSKYIVGSLEETITDADFAIVASGSVTLQLAGAGCPMVVVYKSNKLLWRLLGKWLIRTKHLSLVNILAGRQLVPEFMPYIKSEQQVLEKCTQMLQDKELLTETSKELTELASPLAEIRASQRSAEIIMQMLENKGDS